MDIPRATNPRKKWLKRIAIALVAVGAIAAVTVALSRLKPAAPTVDRASVWLDTVKRGPMVRQVRGVGTLVPEELLWVPAATGGRVERILMRPGAPVTRRTVLVVLDPALRLAAVEAEYQVKAAEARYQDLEVQLRSQRLTQQAEVARIESDYQQARLKADRNEILAKEGLLADIDLRLTRSNADLLDNRRHIEGERLAIHADSADAQLKVQKAEVERLEGAPPAPADRGRFPAGHGGRRWRAAGASRPGRAACEPRNGSRQGGPAPPAYGGAEGARDTCQGNR